MPSGSSTQTSANTAPNECIECAREITGGRWWVPDDHGAVYVRRGPTASPEAVIEPVLEPLRAMWGASDRDMYFVGPGLILHHDGGAFTPEPVGGLYTVSGVSGVHADGASEVWAVGASPGPAPGMTGGDVFHKISGAWTGALIDPARPLNAVWAAGPGEAIAVGAGGAAGTILRWERSAPGVLVPEPSPIAADLRLDRRRQRHPPAPAVSRPR